MKSKFKWIGIALLAAVFVFGLTGCPEPAPAPTPPKKSDVATLSKIVIGDDADTVSFELADPISEDDYNDVITNLASVPEANVGSVVLQNSAAYGKGVTLTPTHNKASIAIARWTNVKPTDFLENGDIIPSLTNGNSILIEVESESAKVRNYYVFKVNTLGAVSSLSGVKIGDVSASPLGTPGDATWPTETGAIVLNNTTKTGVLSYVKASAAANGYTSVEYAVSATEPTALATLPSSGTTESITAVDGEFIWIKVVSENKESTSYYKIEMQLGRVATLAGITIGGVEVAAIPAGATSLAAATVNDFEPLIKQPDAGFSIVIEPTDPDATVKWFAGNADPANDAAYTSPATFKFDSQTVLYIWTKSANGNVNLYHKFKLILIAEAKVKYGQPVIKANSEKFIDDLWDSVGWDFDVSRVNTAEMTPTFAFTNSVVEGKNHTSARAKAMWDDTGLYVYVDVDFLDFYATQSAKDNGTVTKNVAVRGPANLTTDNAHLSDSVEIFTNERVQRYTSGNFGNQFRVAAYSGTDAVNTFMGISGNAGSPMANSDPVAIFRNSNEWSSWVKMVGTDHKGYVVIAKVPWTHKTNTLANEIFDGNGLVKTTGTDEGPMVGMEIQLNTSSTEPASGNPARSAILTWNGVGGQSYNNCGNYGQMMLVMGDAQRVIKTEPPTITTQPAAVVNYTSAELIDTAVTRGITVAATGPTAPAAVLSYQWYRATTADGAGTPVTGASGAFTSPHTYKPIDAQGGKQWYYVVITNTNTAASTGYTTASVTSNRTEVNVTSAAMPVFTTHPKGAMYNLGTTPKPLSFVVTPTVAENTAGTYSYQWWKGTSAMDAGAEIASATSATYTPTLTLGNTWYWVVVTNTATSDSTKAIATSNKAVLQVVAADAPIDFVMELTGTGPNGGQINDTAPTGTYARLQLIDLGADFDVKMYDSFTFEFKRYLDVAGELVEMTPAIPTNMQLKWKDTPTSICSGDTMGTHWGWDLNPVPGSGVKSDIPGYLLADEVEVGSPLAPSGGVGSGPWTIRPLRYLDFETRTTTIDFLEITSITFHLNPNYAPPIETWNPGDPLILQNFARETGEQTVNGMKVTGVIGNGDSVQLKYPTGFNIAQYEKVKVTVKSSNSADGMTPTSGTGNHLVLSFFDPWDDYLVTTAEATTSTLGTKWLIGQANGPNAALGIEYTIGTSLQAPPAGFRAQRRNTTTAASIAYAIRIEKVEFIPFPPPLEGAAPEVLNPKFTLSAANATLNADGSIKLASSGTGTSAQGGGMYYAYPQNYKNYDYAIVNYEIVEFDTATSTPPDGKVDETEINSRQNATGQTGNAYNGDIYLNDTKGDGGQYLNLNEGNKVWYRIDAATGTANVGFRWDYNAWNWNVAGRPSWFTVKVSKIQFISVPKYTITFDSDFAGAPALDPVLVLQGTEIGNLPSPSRDGFIFTGWFDGTTPIGATFVPTSNLALKAHWKEIVAMSPISLVFDTTNTKIVGTGSVDILDGGTGYEFTYGGAYQASWVRVTLTLPTDTYLGEYDTITFKMTGVAGDTGYKNTSVLAGTPLPAEFTSDPVNGVYRVTTASVQYQSGTTTMTFTIDKGKAAGLKPGEPIELSFYEQSGATGGTPSAPTKYRIEDVVISQATAP